MIGSLSLTIIIAFINSLLSIGIAVTAFALLIYIIRYNWRSPVARAFSVLLTCVMFVSMGDAVDLSCRRAGVDRAVAALAVAGHRPGAGCLSALFRRSAAHHQFHLTFATGRRDRRVYRQFRLYGPGALQRCRS